MVRVFRIPWRFYYVAGNVENHKAAGGLTVWALSGDQQIPHVFKVKEVHLMYRSPLGNEHYVVVRQSQLGEAKTLFGCQTVPICREKYMICLMSFFVRMVVVMVDTLLAGDWYKLRWNQSRISIVDKQHVRQLALQPQGERTRWQWTR